MGGDVVNFHSDGKNIMGMRAIGLLAFAVALDASAVSLLPSKTEVVVSDDAPSIVRYAATEATNFLARILGAPVPIVAKAHRDATPVWLGDSPAARKAGIDVSALKRDEFAIRPLGPGIVIAGRDSDAADPFVPDPHKQGKSDKWQPRTERI